MEYIFLKSRKSRLQISMFPLSEKTLSQNIPFSFTKQLRTSLEARWLRIHLPMQGTWVPLDPWSRKIPHAREQLGSCATTAEPVLQGPQDATAEVRSPGAQAPQEKPRLCNWRVAPCSPKLEKARVQQQRPSTAQSKYVKETEITVLYTTVKE